MFIYLPVDTLKAYVITTLSMILAQRLVPRIGGGMVAAFEVLIATNPVRNLIREGRSNQLANVMLTGTQEGMITLEYSLASLIYDGIITYEDGMAVTAHPKDLVRSIDQMEILRSRA